MATVVRDFCGLRCHVPTLKMTNCIMRHDVTVGDVLEVTADCDGFESDVRTWCSQWKKELLSITASGKTTRVQVQI